MANYVVPVVAPVSASWQSHKDRTPPSSEPGTDYACAYGTIVVAVDNGIVTYVKNTNSGAMGRVVEYDTDSGGDSRSLHLSGVWVSVGDRLTKGAPIGVSGASGYGSDWYYGPHTHQTAWPGDAWDAATIDFETLVNNNPVPPTYKTGDDMEVIVAAPNGVVVHLATGVKHNFSGPAEYNTLRDNINFLISHDAMDAMRLPELGEVPNVTWDVFNYLCEYFGVPAS